MYADAIYVSRFDHNFFFFARGRFALGCLVTGPVQWAPFVEGRFLKRTRIRPRHPLRTLNCAGSSPRTWSSSRGRHNHEFRWQGVPPCYDRN